MYMFIPEFWCGVIATVGIELLILGGIVAYYTWKSIKFDDEKEGK